MTPEKHAQLTSTLSSFEIATLFRAAATHRIAVHHLVDHVLGHRVWARYANLEAAAEALGKEMKEALEALREKWVPDAEPALTVIVVGGETSGLEAVAAALSKHLKGEALPVRIQVGPSAWVIARHMGDAADVRDLDPGAYPELLGELATLIQRYPPGPYAVEEEELARALYEVGFSTHRRDLYKWDELPSSAREGYCTRARALLARFIIQRQSEAASAT